MHCNGWRWIAISSSACAAEKGRFGHARLANSWHDCCCFREESSGIGSERIEWECLSQVLHCCRMDSSRQHLARGSNKLRSCYNSTIAERGKANWNEDASGFLLDIGQGALGRTNE